MLEKYLRKNFSKFVELGEFKDDNAVEHAFRRHRVKARSIQIALSLLILLPVFWMAFSRFEGAKGTATHQTSAECYAIGNRAFEEGDYEKAVEYLERAVLIGLNGDIMFNTYLRLADSLCHVVWADREEPYKRALLFYEKALNAGTEDVLAPNRAWIFYQMGNCSRIIRASRTSPEGRFQSAIDYYDEVIINHPDSLYAVPSMYYKAECYRIAEDFRKAREIYYELYVRYPAHDLAREIWFDIADCFLEEAKELGEEVRGGTIDLRTVKVR